MDQKPQPTGTTGVNSNSSDQDQATQTTVTKETTITETVPAPRRRRRMKRQPAEDSEPRKGGKHGVAIVVGILITLVLVGLIGFVIWLAIYRSQPRQIVLDAVENFLTADSVTAEGSVVLVADTDTNEGDSSENDGIRTASIELKAASNSILPNSTEAWLKVGLNDGTNLDVKLGTVQLASGVAYVQVSGLMNAVDQLELDLDQWQELSTVFDILEIVDNEWWEISIPNIIDSLELEQATANGLKGVYNCAIDAMNRDNSGELTELYREYQFIDVANAEPEMAEGVPSGHNIYKVGINRELLANFINALPESEAANEFFACYNRVVESLGEEKLSARDFNEITADEIELPAELSVYLVISDVDRQITRINGSYKKDGQSLTAELNFKYDAVTVTTPSNYRPITDLVDEIIELLATVEELEESGEIDETPTGTIVTCPNGLTVDNILECPEYNQI